MWCINRYKLLIFARQIMINWFAICTCTLNFKDQRDKYQIWLLRLILLWIPAIMYKRMLERGSETSTVVSVKPISPYKLFFLFIYVNHVIWNKFPKGTNSSLIIIYIESAMWPGSTNTFVRYEFDLRFNPNNM